ncbi:regulatory protein RecX [Ornithinicoccus halotolerans]|uniref:regulatory protein RecX n=1 Tax=Ornithinicoccus halotolerans TaxID=1748220 RepID=UPI00129578F2|nr:regulatory protein RecX [Ornithinicoccus halotolerans]
MSAEQQERLRRAQEALAQAEQAGAGASASPGPEPVAPARPSRRRGRAEDDVPEAVREDDEPDPYAVARQIVLRQLTMAPRSRQQLADKLRQRGCEDEVATAVLDRMEEVGLVDDAAYARMLVHSRRETKGLSARALGYELRRKGVAEHHIEAALEDTTAEDERAQARALAQARLTRLHGLGRDVQTRRLAGFLARKGYGAGVAYGVVREVLDEAAEHQRD